MASVENGLLAVSSTELAANRFLLLYNCVKDEYSRPLDLESAQKGLPSWDSLATKEGGVYRKVEPDWRTFLTSDGSGAIRWTVRHPGARVASAQVAMTGWATFRSGELGASLVCGERRAEISLANQPYLAEKTADRVWGLNREQQTERLRLDRVGAADQTELTLNFADLEANRGLDHDLDDAQMFRTPVEQPNPENLVLDIQFEPQQQGWGEVAPEKVEQLADQWRDALQQQGSDGQAEVRRLLVQTAELSPVQRILLLTAFRRKFGLELAQLIRQQFGFHELVQALLERSLEGISVREEVHQVLSSGRAEEGAQEPGEVVSRQILHLQMAQKPASIAAAGQGIPVSALEREGVHCFLLKYDCVRDQYRRPFNMGGPKQLDGWPTLLLAADGVARLTEKQNEEFAFLGSNGPSGHLVWRVEHPGAKVARVEVLLSGMGTPGEMGDENAKIGVDLRCGEHESQRRPDAIPFNAQRIDVMEMERVGPADSTEVRVHFQRSEAGGKPSQLFRAVFGEAATADDFVIRIEFEQPPEVDGKNTEEEQRRMAGELAAKLGQLKAEGEKEPSLVQIVFMLGALTVRERHQLFALVKREHGIDPEAALKGHLPKESAELVDYLLKEPVQPQVEAHEEPKKSSEEEIAAPRLAAANLQAQKKPVAPVTTAIQQISPESEAAAEKIEEAIGRVERKEMGPDQLVLLLLSYNRQIRQELPAAYARRHSGQQSLAPALEKALQDLPEAQRRAIAHALLSPTAFDAELLRKAMKGLGTTESMLNEILVTRSFDHLQAVKGDYGQLYGRELEEDIADDTSGEYRQTLVALLNTRRSKVPPVGDPVEAEKDADRLMAKGKSAEGDPLVAMLAGQSGPQLREVFAAVERKSGQPMEKFVESHYGGDARDVVLMLVHFVRDPQGLFVDWLDKAMEGKGARLDNLVRLIATRFHTDLGGISAEFERRHGVPLEQAVAANTTDPLKSILVAMVRASNGASRPIVPTSGGQQQPQQSIQLRPSPPSSRDQFDVEKAAETVHKAIVRGTGGGGLMKMFKKKEKSDTEAILHTLLATDFQTRQLVAQAYKRRFEHEDMVEAIRREVQEEPAKELVLGLVDQPADVDALNLHKAIAGLGTTESVLIEILVTRGNGQLQAVKKAYSSLFSGAHLEADVGGDTSGVFKRLLVSLCAANRDESGIVQQQKAVQDAQSLLAGGEKKWGTDEETFIALLAREGWPQLRELAHQYSTLTGHQLDDAIRAEFSGDARDAMQAIVRFARNPGRLFAEWIRDALKANKEHDLIRLLTTHPMANLHLGAIAAEFHLLTGVTLAAAIHDSKIGTKEALVSLVNRGGVF